MAAWMWKFGKVLAGITQKAIEWGLADDPREDRREVLEYLAKMGSPELARAVAQKNGQGEWFDELLRQNPDLTKQVVQAYKDTRGYLPGIMTIKSLMHFSTLCWGRKKNLILRR